ncbi:MAG: site-2 protease family protein [Thermoflexales bacterium]
MADLLESADTQSINLSTRNEALMLRAYTAEVLNIEEADTQHAGTMLTFVGRLRVSAEEAFARLKHHFAGLGYVPLLREEEGSHRDMVVAVKGRLEAPLRQRPIVHIALLLATIASTVLFGGLFASALSANFRPTLGDLLANGVPFSLTLLSILGVHELGHYIQARRHNLPVSLPYFIPLPLPGTLGTLGAFIQMRGAVENKRALFDVGIGGPLAGLAVAIPLFVVGLLQSELASSPAPNNRSWLMIALIALFRPEALDYGILLNPVLLAARFGLVITAINLLPIGQLDGGHIAYAALGRRWATLLGYLTLGALLVLGVTTSSLWLTWLLFALFSGLQRPQPLDELTPLDKRRSLVFIATTLLFFSLFTARPL